MVKLNVDKDSLEKALSSAGTNSPKAPKTAAPAGSAPEVQMTPEEEIGFHKGALNTLAAERNELIKMVANVEAIMQAHIGRLKELGVNIETKKE